MQTQVLARNRFTAKQKAAVDGMPPKAQSFRSKKRHRVPLAEKIKSDRAFLSLTELSQVTRLSLKKLSAYANDRAHNGFPLFEKKVTLRDFDAWYHRLISFEISVPADNESCHQSGASPLRLDASRPHVQPRSYGSKPALQPFR